MKRLIVMVLLTGCIWGTAIGQKRGRMLSQDDFSKPLDTTKWIVEMANAPQSSVYADSGRLVLDTRGGVTVWLNRKLTGNIHISFNRKVRIAGKENDRLSDLNVFWMASDPRNEHLFTRNGIFERYDSLRLYYVGMGGNTNTTTRFRKYLGDGTKPLLQEYLDPEHLLEANKEYHIDILVKEGVTTFLVDDVVYFTYKDALPLSEGYFGFRATWSRQEITDFSIRRLQ
jgi:hypothetical protein